MKIFLRLWLPLLFTIWISYLFLDRPLCEFVHDQGIPEYLTSHCLLEHWPALTHNEGKDASLVVQLVEWPPLMSGIAPLLMIFAFFLKSGRPKYLLNLMGISILLTFVLKNELKWVFSRYWPVTWTHQNLSWISDHAYGFQWFQGRIFLGNDQMGSFPSGHAAIAFAALLPVGMVYRKLMPSIIFLALLEALFMVAFNYHFLSDIIAGIVVGSLCAMLVDRLLSSTDTLVRQMTPGSSSLSDSCASGVIRS